MSVLKNFCHNWTQPLENKITSAVSKVKPIFCSSFYFERTKKTHCKERNKDAGSFNRKLGVQKKDATLAWRNIGENSGGVSRVTDRLIRGTLYGSIR